MRSWVLQIFFAFSKVGDIFSSPKVSRLCSRSASLVRGPSVREGSGVHLFCV